MASKLASLIEWIIIDLNVVALLLIFQTIAVTLYSNDIGLKAAGGAGNSIPFRREGKPEIQLVKMVATVIASLLAAVTLFI